MGLVFNGNCWDFSFLVFIRDLEFMGLGFSRSLRGFSLLLTGIFNGICGVFPVYF